MSKPHRFYLLRPYVVIAAGILLIGLALDSVLLWILPSQTQDSAQRYAQNFALVESVLLENGSSPDAIASRFEDVQGAMVQALALPVLLFDTMDLQGQQEFIDALSSGEIVSFADSESRSTLYKRIADTGQVLAIGPLPKEPISLCWLENLVIASYYVLVALLLFLWIRPFYRDLGALRSAASQFGREDFTTRVEVAQNSSILPVAQSFNRMAERIQYLVTAHRELTNAVAHELRTPLARFKFSLEMLSKSKQEERATNYLKEMKGDVQELEILIDEMLNYAKLSEENLQLQRSAIPLQAWLKGQMASYKGVSPRVSCERIGGAQVGEVMFNADLMARAIHNIVRNCLRYAESEIRVSCGIEGERVSVSICDDGPGIPEQYHQSIFEPFARLDSSRDRNSGGYGLGLAIAKRILERHGGNISVNNGPHKGACFVLSWPYI